MTTGHEPTRPTSTPEPTDTTAEYGAWEPVIGLEIHVQLATESKIFCGAPTAFGEPPNTQVDPVSLGMPGVLPVLNREVVELALRVGLALGCSIDRRSRFARKHYFYPDLPKGYQISQFDEPICTGGGVWADVETGDGELEERWFPLTRIHLEEDAGKTVHDGRRGRSYVDCNRAGVPLIETVSEPNLRTPAEAVAYMRALHEVVVTLGACHGNLEQGNFRCDANVSVRRRGAPTLGTRTELKNINSFRFVGRAIAHEIDRHIGILSSGGEIVQETRLWDDDAGVSRSMRSKEEAHDYRYFPDPDLMAVEIPQEWLERVRAALPELPRQRRQRFEDQLGLSAYDARVLTASPTLAGYFEQVAAGCGDAKLAANWVQGELLARLNRQGLDLEEAPVSAAALGELLEFVGSSKISGKMAKECFAAMFDHGGSPGDWVARHGGQITDVAAIDAATARVLDAHPAEVAQFLDGREKVVGFFVGRVMRETQGKANPKLVNEVVRRLLGARR